MLCLIAASPALVRLGPLATSTTARQNTPVMQVGSRERALLAQRSNFNGLARSRSGVDNQRYYDQLLTAEGRAASRGNQRNAQDRALLRGRPYGDRGLGGPSRGFGFDRGGRGFDRGFDRGYPLSRRGDFEIRGSNSFRRDDFFDRGRGLFDSFGFGRDRYDSYYGDFRGRTAISEAILYYTISDIVLRVLAVYCFGHAAGSMYGWLGFWTYLGGHAYVSRATMSDGFLGVVNALGSSVSGLFPLVSDSNGRYSQSECLYSTLACIAFVLAGLFWPGLPHPKPDPTTAQTFKMSVSAFITIASAAKLTSFAWYVYPDTYGSDYDY